MVMKKSSASCCPIIAASRFDRAVLKGVSLHVASATHDSPDQSPPKAATTRAPLQMDRALEYYAGYFRPSRVSDKWRGFSPCSHASKSSHCQSRLLVARTCRWRLDDGCATP